MLHFYTSVKKQLKKEGKKRKGFLQNTERSYCI